MTHDLTQVAEDFFLDYVNNFMTVGAIAAAYHIPPALAKELIEFGRFVHLNFVHLNK